MLRIPVAMMVLAALVTSGSSARADVFTDRVLFLDQLTPELYLETFDSLSASVFIDSPILFAGNGFAYDAATLGTAPGFSNLNAGGGDIWLSTNSAGQTIRFTITGPRPVTAIGGNFFLTNTVGDVVTGQVTVGLNDGTEVVITNPTAASFLGFTSNMSIAWLDVRPVNSAGQIQPNAFVTINNLIVGQVVPEPSALALGAIGLGLMAGVSWRRRVRAIRTV